MILYRTLVCRNLIIALIDGVTVGINSAQIRPIDLFTKIGDHIFERRYVYVLTLKGVWYARQAAAKHNVHDTGSLEIFLSRHDLHSDSIF